MSLSRTHLTSVASATLGDGILESEFVPKLLSDSDALTWFLTSQVLEKLEKVLVRISINCPPLFSVLGHQGDPGESFDVK